MKLFYVIFFLICLIEKIKSGEYCCCVFIKDAFRGFQLNRAELVTIDMVQMDKEFLGYKIMNTCSVIHGGFPTFENVERMKKEIFSTDKKACEKECTSLQQELNEKFNVSQEKSRERESKKLKEKRRKLMEILNRKIADNVIKFHHGKKTERRGAFKDTKNSLQSLKVFAAGVGSRNRKFTLNSDLLSCSTVSINPMPKLDYLKTGNTNESEETYKKTEQQNENYIEYEYLDTGELKKIIARLELESLYLDKKNKRPIDFILDRFNIQDDILVMIIKIFEATLDDVLDKMKEYFDDTVYFQFRIADKYNKVKKV